jgi:hypothetical protein
LDADDIWLPGHLGEMAKVMEMRPEIGIAYDKGYFISVEGKILSPMFFEPHKPTVTPDDLLPNQCFGVGSVVVRHSALENTGDFDESICGAEDHDLWLRIMEKYPATHVPFYGFCYRRGHSEQLSLNPQMWIDAELVLNNAMKRYSYSPKSIAKRKAVLAYRLGQIAMKNRSYAKSAYCFAKAAMHDPMRASRELSSWTLGVINNMKVRRMLVTSGKGDT